MGSTRKKIIRATIMIMRCLNGAQGTIKDLVEYTGYDKNFIQGMVGDMVQQRIIRKEGHQQTGKRPAQLYSFNKSRRMPEDD